MSKITSILECEECSGKGWKYCTCGAKDTCTECGGTGKKTETRTQPNPNTDSSELSKYVSGILVTVYRQGEVNGSTKAGIDRKLSVEMAESKITHLVSQELLKAEIRGKLLALDKMVIGAGEYHDDPYEYVVPLRHIKEYRADLSKLDLTQPIFRETK